MDCLTELAKGAVSKLGELVVESTVKQFEYMIHHNKIIANMKEEHERLKDMKQALQGKVDADRNNGLEIAPNVQNWLSKVEAIENELTRFHANEVNMNTRCFGGRCPDLAFNYSLGKQATKRTEDVVRLKEEKPEPISYPKPPPRLGSTFTEDIKSLESRKTIITEVIEKLKDDEFKRISICGMGGVGKTTLVKELIQIVETNEQFDKVVMAVVSQNPNYEKIQSQIADMLGLEFRRESIQGRAGQLLERLKEMKKVLIVLDDVWNLLDFERIGLPSREHQKGCKILFTSRNGDVCRQMRSQKNFVVSVLSDDEAWDLFRDMAGDVVDKTDIHPKAKEVASECGGLPLAIVTVARALENREKPAWEDALEQLRNSQLSSFSDMQECVYSRIELSFDILSGEEHKYCLFLCGLFPEDFNIPIESLMRHGVGLGLFKGIDALWKARNRMDTWVNNLKRCFLLLDSEEAGCVKMHDVVRDVVISIASKKEQWFMVQCNAELKWLKEDKRDRINAISIIFDDMKELENGLECPTLKLLQVLSKRENPNSWPENFFQGMSELKVLAMQELYIPKLPSLFQASINLQTLQIEDCRVGDISVIGKGLGKLEILSFANSDIKEIPTEIGQLGSLRLLDLTGCDDLNLISANVLRRLSRLEEFYLRVKNFPWMQNEAFVIELKNMSHQLKIVEIKVRDVEVLPKDLIFKNLERFWVYVVPYTNYQRHGYLESNILQFTATDYNSIKSSIMIKQLVQKCEILILRKVKNLRNIVHELSDKGLSYLKDLKVQFCPNLEYLVDCNTSCNASAYSEDKKSMMEFSNLVELELSALPSLIGFIKATDLNQLHQSIHSGLSCAPELVESTSGHKCLPISGKLFSSNWMHQFQQLEKILLQECTSLEMVFDLQECSQLNGQPLPVLFPQLKEIEIFHLSKLTHVWGNIPHLVHGFTNLRSMIISGCDSLKQVFTPVIARAITKLEKLEISSCELIENLVVGSTDDEDDDYKGKGKVKTVVFDKLYSLSLSNLPSLVSVCRESYEIEWPSLRTLNISDCPMMKVSPLLTQKHEKQDNLGVTSHSNIQDTEFSEFKENHSRSFKWHLGCMPLPTKFIRQGSTDKSSKAVSLTQDHVSSISEMRTKPKICQMPILEDLSVDGWHLGDVLFPLEEKYASTIPPCLKTIKIYLCDKLDTIMASREEGTDMISSFTQLQSLTLYSLPNLARFCSSKICTSLDKLEDKGASEGDQKMIRHGPFINGFLFPNLTSLSMKHCNKITILFSPSSSRSLGRLMKLDVWDCENIEEVVSQEEKEASVNKIIFPGLQHLFLRGLPNLIAFCRGSYDFDFPSLREVIIEGCPNMEVFSNGSSHTPKLEDVTMEIEPHNSKHIHKRDLNATLRGFKAFVALQTSVMLRSSELYREDVFGYFIEKSKMTITGFHNLLSLVPFSEIHMLQCLKALTVTDCDSLVEVFELEEVVNANKGDATMRMTHYELQKINLSRLQNLKRIWKHSINELISFQKLTVISIYQCHSLESLLSNSMAKSLVQLEELQVEDCKQMEEIVTKEDNNTKGGSKVKILFPKLRSLILVSMPELKCFCSGDYDYDIPLCNDDIIVGEDKVEISFPELESLSLWEVPKLKCFCSGAYDYDLIPSSFNEEITEEWPQIATFPNGSVTISTPKLHLVQCFPNSQLMLGDVNLAIHYAQNSEKYKAQLQKLKTLKCVEQDQRLLGYITRETWLSLESCDQLLNCIPSNMMHRFQHLKCLWVKQCGSLEEIFESMGGNDHERDGRMQYQLFALALDSLPKLMHIWKNHDRVLSFHNLRYLTITGCHELKFAFPLSIARSFPNLRRLEVSDCNKMEEIMVTAEEKIQNICEERPPKEAKIIFPQLDTLRLNKLPSLNCFCASSCYFELPLCKKISIGECPKMKTFCYGTVYTPKLYSLSVQQAKCDRDEDLNEIIQMQHRK